LLIVGDELKIIVEPLSCGFLSSPGQLMLADVFNFRESEKLKEDSRGVSLSWLIIEHDKDLIVSSTRFLFRK
jgi:hypothetical protein